MSKYIIHIVSPDGVDRSVIGPFDHECIADLYCEKYLEPKLQGSRFHIDQLVSPEEMFDVVRRAKAVLANHSMKAVVVAVLLFLSILRPSHAQDGTGSFLFIDRSTNNLVSLWAVCAPNTNTAMFLQFRRGVDGTQGWVNLSPTLATFNNAYRTNYRGLSMTFPNHTQAVFRIAGSFNQTNFTPPVDGGSYSGGGGEGSTNGNPDPTAQGFMSGGEELMIETMREYYRLENNPAQFIMPPTKLQQVQ